MFTGLIRELATVESFNSNFLTLNAKYRPKIGDSIAVNGTCLTVVSFSEGSFSVELSNETLNKTAIENLTGLVHIEPAMRLEDRLEGHIVQGHIDCIGEIIKIEDQNSAKDFYIKIPDEYMKFVIPKGSITVDGISLTLNDIYEDSFRLTIIPHTFKNTIIGDYKIGTKVNIETDMFARYLYHLFKKEKTLTWNRVDSIMSLY